MSQSETSLDTNEPDPSAAKIIVVVRVCLIHNGMRTTITDVARRVGMSRPTVYRKLFTLEETISEILTQEVVKMLGDVTNPTSTKELTEIIMDVTNRVRRSGLMRAILSEESELLATYQFHRLGHSQLAIIDVLERILRAPPGPSSENPEQQALFILILVQSVAFMANTASEYFDDVGWEERLHKVLKGCLQ